MEALWIMVSDRVATYRQRGGVIVCGNKDYRISFIFDSEWDVHAEKTARFIWNGKYFDQTFTGNECKVPVISNATEVIVGVYAGDLRTTTPAKIPCLRSILCGTSEATDGQVEEYRDEAKKAAEEAKAAVKGVVSPVVAVTDIEGGHRVTIKDAEGEKVFDVLDGVSGTGGSGGGLTDEQLSQFNALVEWYNNKNYAPMTVSISPNSATYELGSKQDITFKWTFSEEVSAVTFDGKTQAATKTGSIKIEGITTSGSYTVSGTRNDGQKETKSASSNIQFQNRFYYGCATDPRETGGKVDSKFIRGLSTMGYASSRMVSFNAICPSGQYIWYAYPKRFGLATVTMGTIGKGGFEAAVIVSVTNSSGHSEDYYVYRSINTGLTQPVQAT